MRKALFSFVLLFLLPTALAITEGISGSDFFSIVEIGGQAEALPPMPYVAFNVDAESGEEIIATYEQWAPQNRAPDGACVPPGTVSPPASSPQPNNALGQWPGDSEENFWIQFVSPQGIESPKETCTSSPCQKSIPVTEGGAWQVRFGAGILNSYCQSITHELIWIWGISDWSIEVPSGSKGRVWKEEWHLSTQSPPFTKNFYPVVPSVESSGCETSLFNSSGCSGELFRLHFDQSNGLQWTFVSNSNGVTYTPGVTPVYLKQSVPVQRDTETCLDSYLSPERYTGSNTRIEAEHRIYLREPEFFQKTPAPEIQGGPDYAASGPVSGGTFSFETNVPAYYEVILDLEDDGDFDPYSVGAKDILFEGATGASGPTLVNWGGRDKTGALVPPGEYGLKLRIYSAIVNFPLYDFEKGNLRIQKRGDSGSFEEREIMWHDSTAGGTDELAGTTGSHVWQTGPPNPNPQTNCFPASGYDLSQTVGDQDYINTWAYGDSDELADSFAVPTPAPDFVIEAFYLTPSTVILNSGPVSVEGIVAVKNNGGEGTVAVTLGAVAANGSEPAAFSPETAFIDAGGTEIFRFLFTVNDSWSEGLYQFTARAFEGADLHDSATSMLTVDIVPAPAPETAFFLVPTAGLCVIAIALLSRKKK